MVVIQIDLDQISVDRNTVAGAVQAENIGVGVHFEAIHLHPFYSETLGYKRGIAPVAEAASDRVMSLPLHVGMTDGDVADAVSAVAKVVTAFRR